MLMFSINPVYDYGKGDFGFGENTERYDLYRRCQREGVGISVMKPFCGGQLLDKKQSPFKAALTKTQCIAYALDKPGVITVLPGYGGRTGAPRGALHTSKQAGGGARLFRLSLRVRRAENTLGKCVYCKHCHPCPAGPRYCPHQQIL